MLFASFLFLATISQHALDAGPNTYRDPFQNYRPYDPLYDGLGGRRFDDRFINDGLRFAPEFSRGNSIYRRSLLFDYQASTGWKLLRRNQERYNDSIQPTTRIRLPLVESTQRPKNQIDSRMNNRIDSRVEAPRINQRLDTRITNELRSGAQTQRVAAKPAIKAVPIAPESLPPLHLVLTKEQIVEGLSAEFLKRIERLEIEKKIFGDVQERKLSEEILNRYGVKTLGPAMTILGLTPTIRLQLQLEGMSINDLFLVTENYGRRALTDESEKELQKKLLDSLASFADALKAF